MATGSIIKDVAKAAKAKAVKGIGNAVFGKGLIGGALGKSFQKKFGDQEQENTDVADALKEQESVQDNNNATLTRIETIVMNIADNIYNIAGVLNAQVVSMKEAHRLQQERAFKSAASTEEANSEALQVAAPAPAATTETDAKEKKGGITDLIGSVLSTKKLFKGFLKKFAIFAAGVTAVGLAGFAASTLMSKKDAGETPPTSVEGGAPPAGPNEPQIISSTPPGSASGPGAPPSLGGTSTASSESTSASDNAPTAVPSNPTATPASAPTTAGQTPASGGDTTPQIKSAPAAASSAPGAVSPGPASSAPAVAPPPAPTPAAPPPSVAASAPAKDPEIAKLEDYFNKPENAAEKAQLVDVAQRQIDIKEGIRATKEMMQGPQTPEEKTRNETILKLLEPRLEATKKEKKAILDKARKAIQPQTSTPAAPQPSGGGEAAAVSPSSGGGGGGGGGAQPSSGGGGSGASAVPPSPSSGSAIGAASTAVAAASENAPPKVASTQITNDTTSGDKPPPTAIPSPIAGRGSLDAGTVFGSGS